MAVWMTGGGDKLELPAIERVGRIGHFEVVAGAIRVVEGGISIGYRLTPSTTGGCSSSSSTESPTAGSYA
jgi:hypothetical protein